MPIGLNTHLYRVNGTYISSSIKVLTHIQVPETLLSHPLSQSSANRISIQTNPSSLNILPLAQRYTTHLTPPLQVLFLAVSKNFLPVPDPRPYWTIRL